MAGNELVPQLELNLSCFFFTDFSLLGLASPLLSNLHSSPRSSVCSIASFAVSQLNSFSYVYDMISINSLFHRKNQSPPTPKKGQMILSIATMWSRQIKYETVKDMNIIFIINSAIFQVKMGKSIESEIRRRIEASGEIAKIEQLCLDGIQIKTITPNIKRLLESCYNLEYLAMNDCELSSLDNFPHLKNLIGLELSDNMLTGEDLSKLASCHQINFLTLDSNRISTISYINQLNKLEELEILEIHDNQLCEEENYRTTIFNMFPHLSIVDCIDRDGFEVEQEDPSEYISNIGNSRLDLLELLDQDDDKEDFIRTAMDYHENQDRIMKRSDSADTNNTPTPNNLIFGAAHLSFQRRNEASLARTGFLFDSDSQGESELMKDFKRKFQKKENQ